jgi:hypothetical protein
MAMARLRWGIYHQGHMLQRQQELVRLHLLLLMDRKQEQYPWVNMRQHEAETTRNNSPRPVALNTRQRQKISRPEKPPAAQARK